MIFIIAYDFCHCLDFRLEAENAQRIQQVFARIPGSALRVPHVEMVTPRILIMEFVDGARVDDLTYMKVTTNTIIITAWKIEIVSNMG